MSVYLAATRVTAPRESGDWLERRQGASETARVLFVRVVSQVAGIALRLGRAAVRPPRDQWLLDAQSDPAFIECVRHQPCWELREDGCWAPLGMSRRMWD